eukprot:4446750-Heterocapsa_arctica.AAC.1
MKNCLLRPIDTRPSSQVDPVRQLCVEQVDSCLLQGLRSALGQRVRRERHGGSLADGAGALRPAVEASN